MKHLFVQLLSTVFYTVEVRYIELCNITMNVDGDRRYKYIHKKNETDYICNNSRWRTCLQHVRTCREHMLVLTKTL